MSLYGSKPRYTFGAIRNAQLMPLIYPAWQLWMYYHPRTDKNSQFQHLYVPANVLETLTRLGAKLVPITEPTLLGIPSMWRHLVFDDWDNVEYAIVRNADARLSEREARLVNKWLSHHVVEGALHCIRDHPEQALVPLMGGMWGGKGKSLHAALKSSMSELIRLYTEGEHTELGTTPKLSKFLEAVWTGIQDMAYCHDSVTCRIWNNSHSARRWQTERGTYVGQKFGPFEDGVTFITPKYMGSPECNY